MEQAVYGKLLIEKRLLLDPMRGLNILFFAGFMSITLLMQSCATVFGGRTNTLVFNNKNITEAKVYIDDSIVGNASGKIVLPKKVIQHGSVLEIKAQGYKTQEYILLLKPHAGYIAANFIVGVIPLIVDFATGNILRPYPRKFEVNLVKSE